MPSRRKRLSTSFSKTVWLTLEHEFDFSILVYYDPHAEDFKRLLGRLFLQGILHRGSVYVKNSLSYCSGGPESVLLNCLGVDRLVLAEGLCHHIKRNIYNCAGKVKSLLVGQHYM